jgi:hypothetical protein
LTFLSPTDFVTGVGVVLGPDAPLPLGRLETDFRLMLTFFFCAMITSQVGK